jgi:hypothetical protein
MSAASMRVTVSAAADAFLVDSGHRASAAAVGRMWGFSDAGQFARRFRAACGKCITRLAVSRTA